MPRQQRQKSRCLSSVKTHQRKNAARLRSGTDNRTVLPKSEKRPKIAPKNQAKTRKKSPKIKKKPSIFDQNQQKASKKLTKSETTNTAKTDSSVPMTCQQLAVVINPERSLKADLRPMWTRKTKGWTNCPPLGGEQFLVFVNEGGVYSRSSSRVGMRTLRTRG